MLCCGAAATLFAISGLWRRLAVPLRVGMVMAGLALTAGPATAVDLHGIPPHRICGQALQ